MWEIADWAAGTDACEGLLIATVESPTPAPYAGQGSDAPEMSVTDEGGAGFRAIFPYSRDQNVTTVTINGETRSAFLQDWLELAEA
jgi:hypothetical protein